MLNARAEILLKKLIEQYIDEGTPVGSRMLARNSGLKLSPATVRNVMADLEELGLISAPHTSAGRIPTQSGYRLFVDSMIRVKPVRPAIAREFETSFQGESDVDHLIDAASRLLSEVTQFAGVVMVPHTDQVFFKHIEFLKLDAHRLLVILVSEDGRVQNRVITTGRDYTDSELVEAANYFNDVFAGEPLATVRMRLMQGMEADSAGMTRVIQDAIEMARRVFDDETTTERDIRVSGEEKLFEVPDLSSNNVLQRLFGTFKTKRDLLDLLERSMGVDGIRIFIGNESGYAAFSDCSVVTAPFRREDRVVGTLGVIGPTRMHYDEVIPIVDVTARLLSNALR